MKAIFKKTFKIYKYLLAISLVLYWICVVIDDWIFVEKYWFTNFPFYIGIWLLYFIVYALYLSLCFWGIASIIIVSYHKIIKNKL